jgi:hypothetical protein
MSASLTRPSIVLEHARLDQLDAVAVEEAYDGESIQA